MGYSLRTRLVGAALVATVSLLGGGAVILDAAFVAAQERGLEEQLRIHTIALIGSAEVSPDDVRVDLALLDERFRVPAGGLYAVVHSVDGERATEVWASDSVSGVDFRPTPIGLLPGTAKFLSVAASPIAFYRRSFAVIWELEDGYLRQLEIVVALDPQGPAAELAAWRRSLYLGATVAAVALALLQYVLLTWAMRGFDRLRGDLVAVESGSSNALVGDYPGEVLPLVEHINQFIEHERRSRERYRDALDDLAHALRTPLAAVRNASTEVPGDRRIVDEQLAAMDDLIDRQLARAAPTSTMLAVKPVAVRPVLERLLRALSKVHPGQVPTVTLEVPDTVALRMDERDLMELFGVLLDNAFRYGGTRLTVTGTTTTTATCLIVDDNGPGWGGAGFEALTQRGVRADQRQDGHGIGLAVCADLAERYGLALEAADSRLGGACVSIQQLMPSGAGTWRN